MLQWSHRQTLATGMHRMRHRALEQLKERMAQLSDLRHASLAGPLGPADDDAPAGRLNRAESLATRRADQPRAVHRRRDRPAARRCRLRAQRRRPRRQTMHAWCGSVRRQWDKARRVPTDLAAEMTRAASLGQEAWVEGAPRVRLRRASLPTWSTTSSSPVRYVECHLGQDDFERPYDVVLDDYRAPDEDDRRWRSCSASCVSELVPMIATAHERGRPGRRRPAPRKLPDRRPAPAGRTRRLR